MIFYEAPHKLLNTLKDFYSVFGDRRISICRELTKIHEEALWMTLSESIDYYTENIPKGEFVLVISGCESVQENTITADEGAEEVIKLYEKGMRLKDAAGEISERYSLNKNELYEKALKIKEDK